MVAILLMLETDGVDDPRDADFIGRDCESTEDALGTLREEIALLDGRPWTCAVIVAGKTVADVHFL